MKASGDIKNIKLNKKGNLRIEWAAKQMPVLGLIKQRFTKELLLKKYTIAACLHVTAETANLMITLKSAGAKVVLCASNPLSTQDDVAASLVKNFNIPVYAKNGEDNKTYYRHLFNVLDAKPQITLDDGGDLISSLHSKRKNQLKNIIGSCEETTTGVIRLQSMAKDRALKIPVIAVNNSQTKHFFDNRYGTGQSTIDGILRATNILLAGKKFVVCGYGWCGRGIALRAKGMGSNVIISEVDPVKALEAVMDGYQVMPVKKAAPIADIIVTATGDKQVISLEVIKKMKPDAILANSGHFNVEIDIAGLEKISSRKREIRANLAEYILENKKIYVLAEGRLVNLAAAEGHPAEVMDMSFANQALAVEYLINNRGKLKPGVHILPEKLDKMVAALKLKSLKVDIDSLTQEQQIYLSSWKEGT